MRNTETSFHALVRGIFLGLVQEKKEIKRSAFTMIELVFVIVIVGILSVMIASSFGGNNLRQAADQLVSHIRYTQHLAMMDNKFDANNPDWYTERWQIFFSTYDSTVSYIIYSDLNKDPNPNQSDTGLKEVAKDPLDNSKYLIGANYTSFFSGTKPERLNKKLNLLEEYGIQKIDLSSSCKVFGSTRVSFDNIGRPLRGTFHNFTSSYPIGNFIEQQCVVKLCLDDPCNLADIDSFIQIAIEPETGYTHILPQL